MAIQSYRDLHVWQQSMDLAADAYAHTEAMPKSEMFGLTNQIRRSAVSVPANIAEGYGRASTRSYVHFLKTARGSLKELETHILIAQRVKMLAAAKAENMLARSDEIGRMLNALVQSLTSRPH